MTQNLYRHDRIVSKTKWGMLEKYVLRDQSLFMTGGGPEENRIFRENFSRPTRHRADEKFRGPLDIARKLFDAHS